MAGGDVVGALLREPGAALVAVDFDGTLAPIVARPEDARPASGAIEVLAALAARLGVVAIVSGRPAAEVVELAGLPDNSPVRVLGHYGMQRWRAGVLETPDPVPGIAAARPRLVELVAAAEQGVSLEDKTHSLAVHTRGAADPERALAALRPALGRLADELGLEAVPGRYVVELRPRGIDKGAALTALVAETAARVVVYIGDDVGDLPAYSAVETMRGSGAIEGLTVAVVDPADSDVPALVADRADLVLDGPTAVVAWLGGIAELL
ncbi:MAG TPA: trehalose-phosphatase [Marmoricola sp.]